jgi:pyruvate formate lyase activating enzyme
MKIKGFQGTSLLDFPGRIASLIFFGGCNLTCPFCHNPTLVLDPDQYPDYPLPSILQELEQRRTFIDGVVISGGEPTLDPECINLIRAIKAMGLLVKLDTNGLRPDRIERMLTEGLIDYLAFDLKTAPARYGELHTAPVDLNALQRSITLVMGSSIDYEFRSTCVPGLVEPADIDAMGEAISGAKRWALQQFVPGHALDDTLREHPPHDASILQDYASSARRYAGEVILRGV